MSNFTLDVVTLGLLGLHMAALLLAMTRKTRAWLWLNGAVAGLVLVGVALNARSLLAAADWPLAALGLFEIAVLAAMVAARRGVLAGLIVSGVAFAIHFAASTLAVIFALTFKINRLF